MSIAPDDQELAVNGEVFAVNYDPTQPGAYHFTWLSGPNPGYGFTSGSSTHGRATQQALVDSIVNFLAQIDPETGYIGD